MSNCEILGSSENNILSVNNQDVLNGANNLNNEIETYIRNIAGCSLTKFIKTNLETYKFDLEEYLQYITVEHEIGENSMNLDEDKIIKDIENNITQIEDMIRHQGGAKFRYRKSKKNNRRKNSRINKSRGKWSTSRRRK
jgi:hypothetical protein